MSRLTKYFTDGDEYGYNLCHGGCESCNGVLCGNALEMIKKLARYEDLEEQGRLIELPCKVGDTVYFVSNIGCGFIGDCIKPCDGCNYAEYRIEVLNFEILDYGFLGETVFLTKEEAEAKLAELKGE